MAILYLINGPNLDKLGEREPHHYGHTSLATLNQTLTEQAKALGHTLYAFQSAAEHELIALIHETKTRADCLLLNAGAYSHTSIALRDALLYSDIPFIEIHLSNLLAREPFRHHSLLGDLAIGQIQGFGPHGYHLALEAADYYLKQSMQAERLSKKETCCGHAKN